MAELVNIGIPKDLHLRISIAKTLVGAKSMQAIQTEAAQDWYNARPLAVRTQVETIISKSHRRVSTHKVTKPQA